MNACTRSERDMAMPSGMPMAMAMRVATKMMARVRIVSSHMWRTPMARNATMTPTVSRTRRLAAKQIPAIATITTHQGALSRTHSNLIRSQRSGSKMLSMGSP